MSTYRSRYIFALAGFVAASITALAPAIASSTAAPNRIDNATVDAGMGRPPVTGVYDGNDKYRDARGFPLAGWDYLFYPPT